MYFVSPGESANQFSNLAVVRPLEYIKAQEEINFVIDIETIIILFPPKR